MRQITKYPYYFLLPVEWPSKLHANLSRFSLITSTHALRDPTLTQIDGCHWQPSTLDENNCPTPPLLIIAMSTLDLDHAREASSDLSDFPPVQSPGPYQLFADLLQLLHMQAPPLYPPKTPRSGIFIPPIAKGISTCPSLCVKIVG